MPQDAPDGGRVRPRGGERGGRRVPELVPAAPGRAGPVHEAVEGLVERGVRVREAAAAPAQGLAVVLQDLPQRRRDGEPQPHPGLVARACDEALTCAVVRL